jgi:hypothetical protein
VADEALPAIDSCVTSFLAAEPVIANIAVCLRIECLLTPQEHRLDSGTFLGIESHRAVLSQQRGVALEFGTQAFHGIAKICFRLRCSRLYNMSDDLLRKWFMITRTGRVDQDETFNPDSGV